MTAEVGVQLVLGEGDAFLDHVKSCADQDNSVVKELKELGTSRNWRGEEWSEDNGLVLYCNKVHICSPWPQAVTWHCKGTPWHCSKIDKHTSIIDSLVSFLHSFTNLTPILKYSYLRQFHTHQHNSSITLFIFTMAIIMTYYPRPYIDWHIETLTGDHIYAIGANIYAIGHNFAYPSFLFYSITNDTIV